MASRHLKGMILAAGLGTRLRPLTLERPKPLMEVLGRPLIGYALERMHHAGAELIVINTHYLADQIVQYVGTSYKGIPIEILHEPEILGTGGALKNARSLLQSDDTDVLVVNSDIFVEFEVRHMIEAHRQSGALATLLLKSVDRPSDWREVGTDERDQIRSLVNFVDYHGPALRQRLFCGTHVLSPEAFDEFPPQAIFSSIDAFYAPLIIKGRQLMGFDQPGYYCDAGTPEQLLALNLRQLSMRPPVNIGRNAHVAPSAQIIAPVWIDDDVRIEANAVVGPNAVIGKNVIVGGHAHISEQVIFSVKSNYPGNT